MCRGVKNRIVTCEKCIFWCEKRYEGILALGSPKTHCQQDLFHKECQLFYAKAVMYLQQNLASDVMILK